MPATSGTSRSPRTAGTRLPLSPKVMAHRRGGHVPLTARRVERQAATPTLHITPNVVVAARGEFSLAGPQRIATASQAGALDLHRLRN